MSDIQELKDSFEKTNKGFLALKEAVEASQKEIKDHGYITSLTNLKIEAIQTDLDKEQARTDDIQGRLDAPGQSADASDEKGKRHKYLIDQYCRRGDVSMPLDEVKELKGLTESISPTVGFLVRPEQSNEIIKGVNEMSPIRQIANVITIGTMAWEGPKRIGQFSAVWVSETGNRNETSGYAIGIEKIPVHEMSAMVPISNALAEDSFANIESIMNDEFIEQFGLAEGTAFVSGDAVGKPEGFLINAATLAAATTSNITNLLAGDDFMDLLYGQLKEPYWANATWVLNRTTLRDARKLKTGDGQYLWQPGLQTGLPNMILDRPFILATDMPAVATGAEALAVGDFRRGYKIVDRIGISVERVSDTVTINEGGFRLYARKRVGAQVINAEAIKLLTIK